MLFCREFQLLHGPRRECQSLANTLPRSTETLAGSFPPASHLSGAARRFKAVIHAAAAVAAAAATPQVQAQALKVIPVDEIRRRAAENPGIRLPPGGPNPPSSSGSRTHGQKLRRLGRVDRDRRSSEDLCRAWAS